VTKPRLTLEELREALVDAELEHERAVQRLESARRNLCLSKIVLQAFVRESTAELWRVRRATKRIVRRVEQERKTA
jgi:hypothetical protein